MGQIHVVFFLVLAVAQAQAGDEQDIERILREQICLRSAESLHQEMLIFGVGRLLAGPKGSGEPAKDQGQWSVPRIQEIWQSPWCQGIRERLASRAAQAEEQSYHLMPAYEAKR